MPCQAQVERVEVRRTQGELGERLDVQRRIAEGQRRDHEAAGEGQLYLTLRHRSMMAQRSPRHERALEGEVRVAAATRPRAVRAQVPRRRIGDGPLEEAPQPRAVPGIVDADEDLDPSVEVAMHHVGAPDPDLVVLAVAEAVDPRVLEEAAQDAAHPDPIAHPAHTGTQRADARTTMSMRTPAREAS